MRPTDEHVMELLRRIDDCAKSKDEIIYFCLPLSNDVKVDEMASVVRQWCDEIQRPPCPIDWNEVETSRMYIREGITWNWGFIDADGFVWLSEKEPERNNHDWILPYPYIAWNGTIDPSINEYDWKFCKWQRPAKDSAILNDTIK